MSRSGETCSLPEAAMAPRASYGSLRYSRKCAASGRDDRIVVCVADMSVRHCPLPTESLLLFQVSAQPWVGAVREFARFAVEYDVAVIQYEEFRAVVELAVGD